MTSDHDLVRLEYDGNLTAHYVECMHHRKASHA